MKPCLPVCLPLLPEAWTSLSAQREHMNSRIPSAASLSGRRVGICCTQYAVVQVVQYIAGTCGFPDADCCCCCDDDDVDVDVEVVEFEDAEGDCFGSP